MSGGRSGHDVVHRQDHGVADIDAELGGERSNTRGRTRCARRTFSVVESSAQKIRVSKPCKSGLMGAMASRRRFVGGAQICRTSKNVPTRSNSRSKSNMRAVVGCQAGRSPKSVLRG